MNNKFFTAAALSATMLASACNTNSGANSESMNNARTVVQSLREEIFQWNRDAMSNNGIDSFELNNITVRIRDWLLQNTELRVEEAQQLAEMMTSGNGSAFPMFSVDYFWNVYLATELVCSNSGGLRAGVVGLAYFDNYGVSGISPIDPICFPRGGSGGMSGTHMRISDEATLDYFRQFPGSVSSENVVSFRSFDPINRTEVTQIAMPLSDFDNTHYQSPEAALYAWTQGLDSCTISPGIQGAMARTEIVFDLNGVRFRACLTPLDPRVINYQIPPVLRFDVQLMENYDIPFDDFNKITCASDGNGGIGIWARGRNGATGCYTVTGESVFATLIQDRADPNAMPKTVAAIVGILLAAASGSLAARRAEQYIQQKRVSEMLPAEIPLLDQAKLRQQVKSMLIDSSLIYCFEKDLSDLQREQLSSVTLDQILLLIKSFSVTCKNINAWTQVKSKSKSPNLQSVFGSLLDQYPALIPVLTKYYYAAGSFIKDNHPLITIIEVLKKYRQFTSSEIEQLNSQLGKINSQLRVDLVQGKNKVSSVRYESSSKSDFTELAEEINSFLASNGITPIPDISTALKELLSSNSLQDLAILLERKSVFTKLQGKKLVSYKIGDNGDPHKIWFNVAPNENLPACLELSILKTQNELDITYRAVSKRKIRDFRINSAVQKAAESAETAYDYNYLAGQIALWMNNHLTADSEAELRSIIKKVLKDAAAKGKLEEVFSDLIPSSILTENELSDVHVYADAISDRIITYLGLDAFDPRLKKAVVRGGTEDLPASAARLVNDLANSASENSFKLHKFECGRKRRVTFAAGIVEGRWIYRVVFSGHGH